MLTITFDPAYPQGALEEARDLVELLSDCLTIRRDVELSEYALAAAASLFDAVGATLDSAITTINAHMSDAAGRVQPMKRQAARGTVPAAPLPEAAVEMIGGAVAAIRAEEAARADAAKPAPKLTEPRPAAGKGRRAA